MEEATVSIACMSTSRKFDVTQSAVGDLAAKLCI